MGKNMWIGHNKKVFRTILLRHRTMLEEQLRQICSVVAQEVADFVEDFVDMPDMPFYTGNLADSTGVGVYINGQLMSYSSSQKAAEPQNYKGDTQIWGTDYLSDALLAGEGAYAKGVWIVLFSTVPYAFLVHEDGTFDIGGNTPPGYFTKLKAEMMTTFKSEFANRFPNVSKQFVSV